ncbi:MAG: RNA 2',3'-cyclic phosphodiesterase [Desulfocapsa sp.]|nr:RNA 2',3'-cyclic phosphodiesterase [Desulfocapsa sp.]
MIRLFIALDLPGEIKKTLRLSCPDLPGARWVPNNQTHLTIRFIGSVDKTLFHDIHETLKAIKAKPITMTLNEIGFFPSRKRARVLWVGIEKNSRLIQLHNQVESVLTSLALEQEKRKFVPHITLARFKKVPSIPNSGQFMANETLLSTPPFIIHHFSLYSSVLSSTGAVHQEEGRYPLHC